MSFFPTVKSDGYNDLFEKEIALMPDVIKKAFNLKMIDFSNYLMYWAYVYQFLLMAVSIYSLILGTGTLVKEENDKTIEYLYANPISRSQIVTSKLLAGITNILIVFVVMFLLSFGIGMILNVKDILNDMFLVFLVSVLPVLVYFGIGLFLSSILRTSNAVSLSLGVFFLTYIVSMMADIVEKLKFLSWASPFNYIIPMDVITNDVDMTKIVVLGILLMMSIVGSYIAYNKKELYV